MIFRKDVIRLIFVFLLTVFLFFGALGAGAVDIPFAEVFRILLGKTPDNPTWSILVEERFLRTINAFFAGGALAVVGLVLQSYFRNPLAGPGVLGISSGASLGVAAAIMLPLGATIGVFAQYFLGLAGATLVIFVLILINKWIKGVTLLVVGLMISFFTSAFVSTLLNSSTDGMMRRYIEWGFGSFGMIQHQFFWYYIVLLSLLLIVVFLFLPKVLNVWVLGEQMLLEAGFKTSSIRLLILVVLGTITALVTVHCGPISFVGIAVPQVARMLMKSTNHSLLLPTSMLLGGLLAIFADLLLRTVDLAMPLNGILALFGAPIIVYVIIKGARKTVQI
jgi:iron complex transport system permease protein